MKPIPIEIKGWNYLDSCSCDEEFIEYLKTQPLDRMNATTIFHLGPGMHHKVGLWAATNPRVFVRALTITPEEVQEYVWLATKNPYLNSRYLVDFGDIHLVSHLLLPRFDFIALFHLGEISTQVYDPEYPGVGIEDVLKNLSQRLSMGGEMLFFERSVAWESIHSIVKLSLYNRYSYKMSNFKNLAIYRKE